MNHNCIYVALDVDSAKEAEQIVQQTSSWVGGYKIGPRLLFAAGMEWVKNLSQKHSVFLDLKFYDIPNTMLSSVRSAFELGVEFVTIHAMAGTEALEQIAQLEAELKQKRSFKVLAVTLLTSYKDSNLPAVLKGQNIAKAVECLTKDVVVSGLSGLVCSGEEVQGLKKAFPNMYMVTPGVRPQGSELGDQNRVITPKQAVDLGADMLVVGRPIYQAQDPGAAAQAIYESLYEK